MASVADPGLAWAFLAAGLLFVGIAALLARRPIRLLCAGGKVKGVVTGNDRQEVLSRRGPMRNPWMFFPMITFTAADGRKISIKSKIAGSRPLPMGKVVPLIYDPAHPEHAEIRSFGTLWGFPISFLILGLPFLLEGLSGLGVFG